MCRFVCVLFFGRVAEIGHMVGFCVVLFKRRDTVNTPGATRPNATWQDTSIPSNHNVTYQPARILSVMLDYVCL